MEGRVTSETRKHKSTCGKATVSLLSFRTALPVCLFYSVVCKHFSQKYINLHSIRHYTDCNSPVSCLRVALRARASHACSSRVCLPANASSRLETHTSSAWLAWERGTWQLHSVRELIAPTVSACRCVLRSRKSLFVDGIFTSEPRGSGPAAAEAERRLHSWGSQFDLRRRWRASMSRPNPCSMRSCWRC